MVHVVDVHAEQPGVLDGRLEGRVAIRVPEDSHGCHLDQGHTSVVETSLVRQTVLPRLDHGCTTGVHGARHVRDTRAGCAGPRTDLPSRARTWSPADVEDAVPFAGESWTPLDHEIHR